MTLPVTVVLNVFKFFSYDVVSFEFHTTTSSDLRVATTTYVVIHLVLMVVVSSCSDNFVVFLEESTSIFMREINIYLL